MTAEEFLVENAGNLTDAEYNAAMSDLEKLDRQTWVKTYAPLMQAKGARWNEVDDVKVKDLPTRLREAFGASKFAPGKAYLEDVYYKDFSDVPRKQFDEGLAKMRDYYEHFVDEQEKEAGRNRRKKEVQNWGLVQSALTSDYEKQRYIHEPQSALFGKEAPSLGDAPETRWGSMADLGLGVAGAAGDAAPGWLSMAGPAVRVARDVGHKVTGSPYQKEWDDIGRDAIVDAGLTASTAWLPNFRREKRMLEGALPEAMEQNMKLNRETMNIRNSIDKLTKVVNTGAEKGYDTINKSFRETVKDMPDSYLKRELEPLTKDVNINWPEVQTIINNYQAASALGLLNISNPGRGTEYVHQIIDNGLNVPKQSLNVKGAPKTMEWSNGRTVGVGYPEKIDPYVMDIYNAKPMTKAQQVMLKPATALNDILRGDVGGAILQESKTFSGGRNPKQAKRVERTPEEQMEINRLIEENKRFWEAKFEPTKVEGDLLWEAWQEWDDNRKKKDAIKQSLLRGK